MTDPPLPPKPSAIPSVQPKVDAPRPAMPQPGAARAAIAPNVDKMRSAARETVPPVTQSRSRALPVLYFLGFAILAGSIAWIWQNPPLPPEFPAGTSVGALESRLDALQTRVDHLDARPVEPLSASPFDPAPLLARIAALEARAAGSPASPASINLAPINLAPVEARIAALEARPAASPAEAALSERVGRIARVQAAGAALEAGHKLGNLPDAPPALLVFADAAPPTEAGLRLAFPAAARAALLASRPIDPELPVLSRIWGRLQELVTIRQGERVLIGDPAAGVVAAAQRALDAGDLAGAVAALNRLNPPAALAMSSWTGPAKALLDARSALAAMAASG